ncbi:tyrosine-type recombinase/integrase [Vibrio parahaemolyticus]|uniref:tyrosine-type recombinase/integrase n=1 Tax=Vibrio parahaemolyticus TaxID=670 RepID=UPI000D5300B6|nr:integrase arm-type DNA-binding domain-containing protein [Vibrio parahaemolyticus]AWG82224.1 integrase [Vibrio parahaemolyticus]AWJ81844.1 integrase [Vibrio parahaemolyticus]
MPNLTAKQVASAKPKGKAYRLGDGGGLYFYVRKSGAKSWECRYTQPQTGKPTFLGLGGYPEVSLAEARKKAQEIRSYLSDGIDPKLKKAEQKAKLLSDQKNTLKVVAKLWLDTKSNAIKKETETKIWRSLESYVFSSLGDVPVSKITAPMAIAALKPAEAQGKLDAVKRASQQLNEIMTYAVNYGLIPANPLTGIREVFKKSKTVHFNALSPHDLPELLVAIDAAGLPPVIKSLILWQLHTMVRPSESAGAMWCEIDFENKLWTIPSKRMKMNREHQVPLTQQTIDILEKMYLISSHRAHIFPSIRDPKKPIGSISVNRVLNKIGFADKTTAHGFRSLASTTLNEQGFDADLIEASLSHQDKNAVRKAYNRSQYLEQRRVVMSWWSEHIENAKSGNIQLNGTKALRAI